jgi:ribosomal protein L21E
MGIPRRILRTTYRKFAVGDKVAVVVHDAHPMRAYTGDAGVITEVISNGVTDYEALVQHNDMTLSIPLYQKELRYSTDKVVVVIKPFGRHHDSPSYKSVLRDEDLTSWREALKSWLANHPEFNGDWKTIHCDSNWIIDRGFVGERPIDEPIKE